MINQNVNLKQLRKALGLTQRQVAAAIGLKPGSYCDIENGKKGTKPATAKKLGKVLDFEWTDLYKEAENGEAKAPAAPG